MAYLRGCSVFSCLDSPTWNPLLILMLLGHPGPQWLSGECELCGPYPEVLPGVPGKGLLALLSLPWAIHCVHFYSILRLMPLTKWLRMYIYKIYFSFGVIRGTGNSDMKRKKKNPRILDSCLNANMYLINSLLRSDHFSRSQVPESHLFPSRSPDSNTGEEGVGGQDQAIHLREESSSKGKGHMKNKC